MQPSAKQAAATARKRSHKRQLAASAEPASDDTDHTEPQILKPARKARQKRVANASLEPTATAATGTSAEKPPSRRRPAVKNAPEEEADEPDATDVVPEEFAVQAKPGTEPTNARGTLGDGSTEPLVLKSEDVSGGPCVLAPVPDIYHLLLLPKIANCCCSSHRIMQSILPCPAQELQLQLSGCHQLACQLNHLSL